MGAGALSMPRRMTIIATTWIIPSLDFVGGCSDRHRPKQRQADLGAVPLPPGTPRWGAKWKEATAKTYGRVMGIGGSGSSYAQRGNYLSLDPTYKDNYGQALLRITFDFPENDIRMQNWVGQQVR